MQKLTAIMASGSTRALLEDADRCVKCGLCLPHCPTYAETRHEGDSPRGRITLLQGLASGLVPLTASAEQHLDGCLDCRSCERVCPAQVSYGRVLDRGRDWLAQARPARVCGTRWIGRALSWRWLRTLIVLKLWCYQRLGLFWLLNRIALFRRSSLGRLAGLLPTIALPMALPHSKSALAATRGKVQLFSGCMGRWAERDAAVATMQLLQAAGYGVEVPPEQQCCGALYFHNGLPAQAQALFKDNLRAFDTQAPIVTLASGCASGLRDIAADFSTEAAGFVSRLRDPFALLADAAELSFAPLHARVVVHAPCTQQLLPEGTAPMQALLKKIPGLELVALKSTRQCCGAAGSYFITEAAMADRLLDATLDAIEQSGANIVVSANIGCRLHVAAGLRRRGSAVEVLHPAVLLERQRIRPA